jgi:hypothetical protein
MTLRCRRIVLPVSGRNGSVPSVRGPYPPHPRQTRRRAGGRMAPPEKPPNPVPTRKYGFPSLRRPSSAAFVRPRISVFSPHATASASRDSDSVRAGNRDRRRKDRRCATSRRRVEHQPRTPFATASEQRT